MAGARRAQSSRARRASPTTLFEHDGQITKREVRAVTLSALAPRRGELLWDIGAGSGSVAIEWMLAASLAARHRDRGRAPSAPRASARNAAPSACRGSRSSRARRRRRLAGLPTPDAIFVGGGASEPGVLDAAIAALAPGGRLVANAVTLETEALLIARHAALGGELTRIAIARAARRRHDRLAAGDAGDAMGLGEAMIVAGIGCRKGATRRDRGGARHGAERAGVRDALELLATSARKRERGGDRRRRRRRSG